MTRANQHARRAGSQRAAYARGNGGPDVTITGVTLGHETDKAILVSREGEDDVWLPFSQIRSMTRSGKKGEDTIVVSGWIAKKKGFEEAIG